MKKTLIIACSIALALTASNVLAAGDKKLEKAPSTVFTSGDAEAGKAKSATCVGCHGVDGNSPAPMYPHLAGQYGDYLVHSLRAYKSGARQNAIMQGMVAALSDQDLKDLAAYYASLPGKLKDGTVKP